MIKIKCQLFTFQEQSFNYSNEEIQGTALIEQDGVLYDARGCQVKITGVYELIAKNGDSIVKSMKVTFNNGFVERIER